MRVAGVQGLKQEAYPRRCSVARRVGLLNRTRTSEACVSGRSHDGPKEEGSGLGAGRLYTDSAADDASHPADRGRFPRAGQTTGSQSLGSFSENGCCATVRKSQQFAPRQLEASRS